jgi:fructose-1,6-bisphosphatase
MQVEINVSAADIEKHVTQAIVDSALGTQLKAAIEAAIKNLGNSYSYDSALKKWVEEKVREIIREALEKDYRPDIEKVVRTWYEDNKLKLATDDVIRQIVTRVCGSNY